MNITGLFTCELPIDQSKHTIRCEDRVWILARKDRKVEPTGRDRHYFCRAWEMVGKCRYCKEVSVNYKEESK